MEVPIGMPISMPAQVIATGRMPPLVLRGTVTQFDGAVYDVELEGPAPALAEGDVLVLDLEGAPLVQGHVDTLVGRSLRLAVERTRPREPREFPRAEGDLQVRYQVTAGDAGDDVLDAWLASGRAPGAAPWMRPARLVDWSASGLGFEDRLSCGAGDRLLLEIGATGVQTPWRAVGRVLRAVPLGDDARPPGAGATHRFAVELERVPPEVREALLERTIEAQRLPGEEADPADAP